MKSFCVLNQALNENAGKLVGSAVCAAMGKKIGIIHSADEQAGVTAGFLAAGISDSGGTAVMFGCCNESRVAFLTRRYALSACFYVSGEAYISLYGADGKPVGSEEEKLISELVTSDLMCEEVGSIVEVSSDLAYFSSLVEACGNLEDICADISCNNQSLSALIRRAFAVAGGTLFSKPRFFISRSGTCVSAFDERGGVHTHENLLSICCAHSLMSGQSVESGFTAPRCLDKIAESNSACLIRSFNGGSELWQNDGTFLVARILYLMAEKGQGLATLASVLPDYASSRRVVSSAFSSDDIADLIECNELITDRERRIYARMHDGEVLITPCRTNGTYCMEIIAQSRTAACELADELCLTIGES